MPETAAKLADIVLRRNVVLSHWFWAIPVLLVVSALALRQIDAYPPAADEFFSLFYTSYLASEHYLLQEIVESVQRQSESHLPGFFVLLGYWGHAGSFTLPIARVLPILIGLMALAMTYRLGKDLVGPQAGLIALVIVSSNAFYNYHYAFVRMYTQVVLFAALLLWLYFRIIDTKKRPRLRDFAALGTAVASLMLTHLFGATLLTALGVYHLAFARKDRRWLAVTLSVTVGIIVISPFLLVWWSSIRGVYEQRTEAPSLALIDSLDIAGAWLSTLLNGHPALLVISVVGVMLGIFKRYTKLAPWLVLTLTHLGAVAVLGAFIGINEATQRYHLVGWPPYVLLFAAGLYCLYRFRPLLICLTLAWIFAGLWHQSRVDVPGWDQRLGWQSHVYPLPPWHAVSREAQQAAPPPVIIAHVNMSFELRTTVHINYSQLEHYFDRHGIVFWQLDDLAWFDGLVNDLAVFTPQLWVLYQPSKIESAQQIADMLAAMATKDYTLCESMVLSGDAILWKYSWDMLNCRPPSLASSHGNRLIDHKFFGVALEENAARFIDSWSAKVDFDENQYNLSYQLIDKDWNNVAQVDLPLVHEGKLRQFSIGTSNVPAGAYRLMLILYHKQTGETPDWTDNPGFVPGMIELSEIVIQR